MVQIRHPPARGRIGLASLFAARGHITLPPLGGGWAAVLHWATTVRGALRERAVQAPDHVVSFLAAHDVQPVSRHLDIHVQDQ
jgi:hypothetical protein